MKQRRISGKKLWYSFLIGMLMAVMVCSCPVTVSAKTVKKTVSVKNGKDITKKLQSALDLAKNNKKNTYKITVKPGKYKINGTLKIYSNTTLNMKGVTFKRAKNNTVMLRFGGNKNYKKYNQAKNITLNGGTWDGNGKTGDLMRFGHGQNLTIKNVTYTNVKEAHHMEFAACKNVRITGCTFKKYKGDRISNHVEALQIDIMRKEHFDYYPSYDETPCVNVTIEKCTFDGLQGAVGTHSAVLGSYHENIRIINNKFKDIAGYAIIGMNYLDSRINNNTIENCGLGIVYRTLSTSRSSVYKPRTKKQISLKKNINLEIIGNTITVVNTGYEERSSAIRLYGQNVKKDEKKIPMGDYRIAGLKVQNNVITQICKGVPVVLDGVENSSVQNNKISCDFVKDGASMGNDTGSAILLQNSTGNTISDNTIVNNKYAEFGEIWGIKVQKNTDDNILSGNVINDVGRDGIGLYESSNVTISANKINGSVRRGISMDEECSQINASGNILQGGEDGIYVSNSTSVILSANQISDNSRYGIFATNKATVTASGNVITASGKRDIWAWNDGVLTGQPLSK